jgi:hypothetical protein
VTAVTFLLAGAALWLLRKESVAAWGQRVGQVLAVGVALVGLVRVLGYCGWDCHFDQVLFPNVMGPNRMSPNTALHFLLVGAALLLLDTVPRKGWRPANWLALLVFLSACVSVLGYAYGVQSSPETGPLAPMALSSALGFAVMCLGILCARPERGLVAILSPVTWSIRGQMLALTALSILPALAIILYTGIRQCDEAQRDAEVEGTHTVDELVARQEYIVRGARQMLLSLARFPEVQRRDAAACDRLFAQLAAEFPDYATINASTPDGAMFASSVPYRPGLNVADRRFHREALRTGRFSAG